MWQKLLFQPLLNGLFFFYRLFSNLGWAVIAMTSLLRLVMYPLTVPSLKMAKKMRDLAPEIEKLKKKYKDDKKGFSLAQWELYRREGANPASGCLPQIVQIVVLIAFFQAFNLLLKTGPETIENLDKWLYPLLKLPESIVLNTRFLYLDLTKPDVFRIGGLPIPGFFLLGAALTQFYSSKLMMPVVKSISKEAKKTPGEVDDMAASFQKQSLYLFPLMTIFIGFSFPSGLVLYWFIFSLLTLVQQLLVNKWKLKKN